MSIQPFFQTFLDRVQSWLGARTVYGEPIHADGRTIVPVARLVCGFGGGFGTGGRQPEEEAAGRQARGEGGGGHMAARPVGVIEITSAGTRFVPIADPRPLVGALLLGMGVGLILGRSARRG
jgi:uncharacterized spore protein YtfJ